MSLDALGERVAGVKEDIAEIKGDLKDLESRVTSLERARMWLVGAVAGIGVIVGLLSDQIAEAIRRAVS